MEIRIYNSLTNKIEPFVTIEPGKVSMYVCGPTVYNYPHIGNMRPVVVFDVFRRFFTYVGYEVTYVSNFTDIDDKIINEAIKEKKTEKELTEFYIKEFKNATEAIGSMVPNITPKVTEYIEHIIDYIDNLIKLDAAYNVDGNVYFRVSKIKDYGSLSGINIDDLLVGARIDENSEKESPLDFALWKKTTEGITWNTPWGRGRPGWHTECCVMIDTIFPKHYIDIHGGGYDLKFPHHENEIAQSCATHGNKIAKYWIHNAFINFGNEKMSKSLGNVVFAKDMIKEHGGAVTRLVILSAHYRQPVNFTDETVNSAKTEVNKIQMALKQAALLLQINNINIENGKATYIDNFINALSDDLNTSNALMELFNIVKEINGAVRTKDFDLNKLNDMFKTLTDMLWVLGLPITYVKMDENDKKTYQNYIISKNNKDFETSDKYRNELINKGIM